MIRILAVGDVCAPAGCDILLKKLSLIKHRENIDITVVNGENSAEGNGITPQSAEDIFSAGADVITGGNHSLRRTEISDTLEQNEFLLRPHNLDGAPGSGYCLLDKGRYRAAVINLAGQMYFNNVKYENPFLAADELIARANSDGARFILVDFHAEATSEKRAMGFYLDGKVSAVFGTHTHVATADCQVLPSGTGYITDLGMTGVVDSVLGVKKQIIINRLRDGDMSRFEQAQGHSALSGCIFELDEQTGLCVSARHIYED